MGYRRGSGVSSYAVGTLVSLLVSVALVALMLGFSYLTTPKPTPPRVPTKAELERDARKHWDEQVRALGGVEDELFFYTAVRLPICQQDCDKVFGRGLYGLL